MEQFFAYNRASEKYSMGKSKQLYPKNHGSKIYFDPTKSQKQELILFVYLDNNKLYIRDTFSFNYNKITILVQLSE